jgi:hypothetical protein
VTREVLEHDVASTVARDSGAQVDGVDCADGLVGYQLQEA